VTVSIPSWPTDADCVQQKRAQTTTLPVVDYRQRDLGNAGVLETSDVVRDADPLPAAFIERDYRLVV
jgi:hypothetical protein